MQWFANKIAISVKYLRNLPSVLPLDETREHWPSLDRNYAWNSECIVPQVDQDFTEFN